MSKEKYFQQPSVMDSQSHFSAVPSADIERSRFDRSHDYKTTFNAGELIPVFVDEVLPGDTFTMKATLFTRLSTPLKPLMDNLYQDIHFFFVPYRLCWQHWQEFMGERLNPTDDPNIFSIPQVPIDLHTVYGTTGDYMGLPQRGVSSIVNVSALPFRAYNLIYNEWYRDENLQNRVAQNIGNGPDVYTDYETVLPRGKRKDYFTSCLPWPQKGDPVKVPLLGSSAPVFLNPHALVPLQNWYYSDGAVQGLGPVPNWDDATTLADALTVTPHGAVPGTSGTATPAIVNLGATPEAVPAFADLSAAGSVTINDLRTAFQVQRLLERDARGGTRYIELILSHFGVRSDDARLQRPEYLGGGTTRIVVSPVANTTGASGGAPQGNLAAVATSTLQGGFSKSFTEHGVVIGILSARADLTYQQGIERFWSRKTRYDFYWPALAHLGEQAVLNKEIFAQGTAADDVVFGYQERFAEYRFKPSRITGEFSSAFPQSLDIWHLSQEFGSLPALNASFIEENPPIGRVIAVPSEPAFLADIWFSFQCDRPMPVYSVPGLIDHF